MNLLSLRRRAAAVAASAALLFAGCAAPPAFQVTQPSAGRVGTVESVQSHTVQTTPNAAGAIGGALIGGGIGSLFGGGSGRTVATVVGAAGGAYVGNQAANRSNTMVWTIVVRYDDGTTASIQQTSSTGLRIGDRVRVRDNGIELLPGG